jgi:hypothetical protein
MKMVALITGTASRTNTSGPGAHHSAVPQSPCATQGIREHLVQWGRHLSHPASVCGRASNHLLEHGENILDCYLHFKNVVTWWSDYGWGLDWHLDLLHTLEITVTHRVVFPVLVFTLLLGNVFQQWTFLFLWVPKLSLASATSFLLLTTATLNWLNSGHSSAPRLMSSQAGSHLTSTSYSFNCLLKTLS